MARSAEDDLSFVSVFPYGCLVRVTGLIRCKRFNGPMGMVVQPPQDDTTKHQVQLIGERKCVLVQRKNLCCATESVGWRAMFLEIWPFDLNRMETRSEVPVSAFCCHPSAVMDLPLGRSCKISFASLKSSPLVSSGS